MASRSILLTRDIVVAVALLCINVLLIRTVLLARVGVLTKVVPYIRGLLTGAL